MFGSQVRGQLNLRPHACPLLLLPCSFQFDKEEKKHSFILEI